MEDISPFCGAIDTPVLNYLVTSPLGFKARVGSLIHAWQNIVKNMLLHVP